MVLTHAAKRVSRGSRYFVKQYRNFAQRQHQTCSLKINDRSGESVAASSGEQANMDVPVCSSISPTTNLFHGSIVQIAPPVITARGRPHRSVPPPARCGCLAWSPGSERDGTARRRSSAMASDASTAANSAVRDTIPARFRRTHLLSLSSPYQHHHHASPSSSTPTRPE